MPDMRIFLVKRFKMEGFIVSDHLDLWPDAISELVSLAAAKKLEDSVLGKKGKVVRMPRRKAS